MSTNSLLFDSSNSQVLEEYTKKMRDAENESHEGKRKSESLWPIMRISHARSRYVYELYYKREDLIVLKVPTSIKIFSILFEYTNNNNHIFNIPFYYLPISHLAKLLYIQCG